jgi:hypothetical protein
MVKGSHGHAKLWSRFWQTIHMHVVHLCPSDEDWYPGYHPAWTRKVQGGVCYDSTRHLEDFKGTWRASQGVDNYICKNICKIGK